MYKNVCMQCIIQMRTTNGRGEGTTREVKKKRSDESSEAILKKPKQDTSTASSKVYIYFYKINIYQLHELMSVKKSRKWGEPLFLCTFH